MAQQLTLDLGNKPSNGEFMLWYEDTKATPEQAIINARRYYYEKYDKKPVRVVLPPNWKRNGDLSIQTESLEESLSLTVETNQMLLPKHVAVYPEEKSI